MAEGNIKRERIITMLNVINDELVIEEKGIYSVEKFLLARRLMYWQVYLHKTSLVAEQLLIRVLKRAKELVENGTELKASRALDFFLKNKINMGKFSTQALDIFAGLDDYDIISAMKEWQYHDDFVLSTLCKMIIDRDLLKIRIKEEPIEQDNINKHLQKIMNGYKLSEKEAAYFVFKGEISNQAYHSDKQHIHIYYKNGTIKDIVQASDQLSLRVLSTPVTKYFLCYPKLKG